MKTELELKTEKEIALIQANAAWREAVGNRKQAIAQWDLHVLQLRNEIRTLQGK